MNGGLIMELSVRSGRSTLRPKPHALGLRNGDPGQRNASRNKTPPTMTITSSWVIGNSTAFPDFVTKWFRSDLITWSIVRHGHEKGRRPKPTPYRKCSSGLAALRRPVFSEHLELFLGKSFAFNEVVTRILGVFNKLIELRLNSDQSLFCECCRTNTIRKVSTMVPVLMPNCHVSL